MNYKSEQDCVSCHGRGREVAYMINSAAGYNFCILGFAGISDFGFDSKAAALEDGISCKVTRFIFS